MRSEEQLKYDIQVHKEITQELESNLLKKEEEVTKLKAMVDQQIKEKQADTKSILTYIAIGVPVALIVYLVAMVSKEHQQAVIIAALSFASYFAGSITSPILMNYFGIDKEIQSKVVDKIQN